jgi:hypothetical protein
MTKRSSTCCAVAALALCQLIAPRAVGAETNYHTWVSRSGNDVAGCGAIASPCRTFTFAFSLTISNGEIECLDPVDGLNFPVINKPITITCNGVPTTNVTAPGSFISPALPVAISAGQVVTLRGVNLNGFKAGDAGIDFNGAGTLVLDNVNVIGWPNSGILFRPTGQARLVVSNSVFAGNGNGTTGAGIRVAPTGSAFAQVVIERSDISGNVFGIAADASGASSGGINVTVSDSVISANSQDGIVSISGAAEVNMLVDLSRVVYNGGNGIRSIGATSAVRVLRSGLTGNHTALATAGGQLLTSGSNVVEANAVNGAFTGSFATR